jgi:hypothetical protein
MQPLPIFPSPLSTLSVAPSYRGRILQVRLAPYVQQILPTFKQLRTVKARLRAMPGERSALNILQDLPFLEVVEVDYSKCNDVDMGSTFPTGTSHFTLRSVYPPRRSQAHCKYKFSPSNGVLAIPKAKRSSRCVIEATPPSNPPS